jgi:hypothetical protein
MEPKLMTDLSAATIDTLALSSRGPPPSEGASYIPFADRYAVVPDQGSGQGLGYQVPEVEPDVKRSRAN